MTTISVRGAAEHNLKDIDLDLPREALVVVTGVSGSGKSSLVFDTIGREAQRRYFETFSSYARQFLGRVGRPAIRSISGLSPAIAVDQRTTLRNPRSTVGTLTGLYDDLRLLFARLGDAPSGLAVHRRLFSFNSPHGACPSCSGLGVEDRLDPALLVADPRRTIRQGALVITTPTGYVIYSQVTIDVLDQVCRAHGFDVDTPWRDLTDEQRAIVLNGSDRIRIPYGKHPLESRLRWSGITAKPREEGVYKGILPVMEQILKRSRNRNILRFVRSLPCRACGGSRLRPEALSVTIGGRHIGVFAALEIGQIRDEFVALRFAGARAAVGEPIREAVLRRTGLLQQLGLSHLVLERVSTSLSGGEAQRVRLASQAGADLGGVLYVLDEPSVGLHATEQQKLLAVLRTLRDRGNTVLVVEHDEDTMREADWLVDIGPDAGERGGEVLFSGPVHEFLAAPAAAGSRTRRSLGREDSPVRQERRPGRGALRIGPASRHNLKGVEVDFLIGALNVVTGVSGAGKSSLVAELVERVTSGRVEAVGAGAVMPGKVIHVDQSPIGRTPRSNPATYTGLSDAVRDLFAALPESAARGFGKGRFSFNVAGGRCDACQGAGVQHIGMHFLGEVDVVCEACGGRRFNEETLEIAYRGLNIHDVLDLTLDRASELLAESPRATRILAALRSLGLGYLRLGQPATTLSGGEAQRVKLAAELGRPNREHTLYVLDEPTTGLHAADVAVLLRALNGLVAQGHTVVTIEHHLDVVRASDRVVDLGPGSGREGGRIVAVGTPEQVAAAPGTPTGAALRGEREPPPEHSGARAPGAADIRFTGVRTHNLDLPDVVFPANRFTVVTGVSGSGKSSLAFETLFAEGRNRFTESYSPYARRFVEKLGDAQFDEVSGLTPAVAVRQRRPSRNPRSTVGTMTEIADYYRLLYSRAGVLPCPACGADVRASAGGCPRCGLRSAVPLTSTMFSPNTEQGACPACRGLGTTTVCDPERLVTDAGRSLLDGAMDGHKTGRFYGDRDGQHVAVLGAVGVALGIDFALPWRALDAEGRRVAMRGAGEREFGVEWHYRRGSRSGVHRFTTRWLGLAALVEEEYARKHADRRGEALEPLMHETSCPACGGARLKPERLAVTVAGRNIAELQRLTVAESLDFFGGFAAEHKDGAGRTFWSVALDEVVPRLERLRDAGLDYLSLDRPAATLSSGEAQRVRLSTEVGSGLTGITYVLDEPTAGLHARDTERLLRLLAALRDAGNTVVVVEHDVDVIRAADHVIDLGPGAGAHGGRLVAAGTPASIATREASPTGRVLREGLRSSRLRRDADRPGVSLSNVTCHNLRGASVEIPSGCLVAVTGVSGSGKSTLVFDVLAPALASRATGRRVTFRSEVAAADVTVHAAFDRVILATRESLPSSPASSPASIIGVSDAVREVFGRSDDATERGLGPRHFSTHVKGGRCEACEGAGRIKVSMDFLPDVWMPCEECGGDRFRPEVLACRVGGRSVADVLSMTVADGATAFAGTRAIARPLAVLEEVGLGYLTLGQGADTLSGGERQRLALAADLCADARGPSLYLFDEPTTGLHAADIERLLQVFERLLSAGHSLVVVEHHLDVIAAADHVIDLGPDGGSRGGRVVAVGTPAQIATTPGSYTGGALRARV